MDLLAPLRIAADLALPPRCPGCGAITGQTHRFCGECWNSLRFIMPPWCARCHTPFAFDRGAEAHCATCIENDDAPISSVDAAVAYGPVASRLALRLKYGGRDSYAITAARLMHRALPDDITLLVPVPLHRWRLWGRGYNQAALIAAALGQARGLRHDPLLLRRRHATPVLRGLSPRQRRRAVAGAFDVDSGRGAALRGERVALVDDVYTSGATAQAAARVLLRAGAARVSVICWARVLGAEAD